MDTVVHESHGLSEEAASRLLTEYGPNELPQPASPTLLRRAARQLADPMSVLLLLAGLVTLVVLGEIPEGAAILTILFVNVVIGVSQEARADRAVRALRTLTAPMAKVIREGTARRVPAAAVVPGDVIEVSAGDRVPADAHLLEASSLAVDEAMLTGESSSADKQVERLIDQKTALGDRIGEVFSGTLVVRGSGMAEVVRTGAHTEMGRIAAALHSDVKGPLEVELGQVSRRIGILAVAAGALMILIGLTRVSRGEATLIDIILAGVALAIAAVPESLAAAVTTALALGMRQLQPVPLVQGKVRSVGSHYHRRCSDAAIRVLVR
jgi:Ca2+-transporting ATPase